MSQELTLKDAQKFLQDNFAVDLSEFKSIADDAAAALAKCKDNLSLTGLTTLSDAAAESLSKHNFGGLSMDGLTKRRRNWIEMLNAAPTSASPLKL